MTQQKTGTPTNQEQDSPDLVSPDLVPFTYGARNRDAASGPRTIALLPADHAWMRRAAAGLRSRGIADDQVEALLTEVADTFVRRGRDPRDVYGPVGAWVKSKPRGTARHSGHLLAMLAGVPMLVAGVVLALLVLILEDVDVLVLGLVAAVLVLGGAAAVVLGRRKEARLPAHIRRRN